METSQITIQGQERVSHTLCQISVTFKVRTTHTSSVTYKYTNCPF